jgi:predicted SprT family Zn-dependent metalloprotease
VFDRLNREYFRSSLRGYRIEWGRRTAHRAKRTFVFAYIRESEKLIRVNPWLDQAWVPEWFLRYVVFHEMLHAVVPDDFTPSGRRRVHHPEFVRREREFPHYRKARRWLDANLARLLA